MSMRPKPFSRLFLSVWAAVAVLVAGVLYGEVPQVGYETYTSLQGESFVAVGLRAEPQSMSLPTEVVFLIDTSASQVGQTRRDVLAILETTIAHLPADCKVRLFAMDVETEALMPKFAAKDSKELSDALATLRQRVPLGATDMGQGFTTARAAFEGRSAETRRAVIYLGNGRSVAKTVDVDVFEKEVAAYREQQIPFTACVVGVRPNFMLVGAFANHTGGQFIDVNAQIAAAYDTAEEAAERNKEKTFAMPKVEATVGRQLAEAVATTIVWPTEISAGFPENWDVYPRQLQPIRSDRDTIVLAKTDEDHLLSFALQVNGRTFGGSVSQSWTLKPAELSSGNNYLASVVETAARGDNARTMPIVNWDMLSMMRDGFVNDIKAKIDQADAAIKTGNSAQAKIILDSVLKLDPNNRTAQRLFQLADESVEEKPQAIEQDDAGITGGASFAPNGSLVDTVAIEQAVSAQKVQNEVRRTIVDATQRMNDDPEGAIQNIKLAMVMVRDNTTLMPDERNAMLDSLGNTLKQTQHAQYVNDFKRQQADMNASVERDHQQTLHDFKDKQDKLVQLFDRFASLMNAGEYKSATVVAEVAMDMVPESTTPFQAQRLAEMTSYIMEYAELRHRRHVGFVEALMESERSFIPLPTEPPLTYIEPERWLLLSERRKERYAVSDLSQSGAAERKISKALEKNMDFDLDENVTFEEFFAMITDKNPGINIAIDPRGAGALGITNSSPVVREPVKYNGIKLRSALRLILSEQDLTYCIKNEVLLITSEEEAKKYMSIKVYPVADLVVDPTPIAGNGSNSSSSLNSQSNGGNMSGGGGSRSGGGGGWSMGEAMRRSYGASQLGGKPANGFGGSFSLPETIQRDNFSAAKKAVAEAKTADDARKYWENYFAAGEVDAELVKEIVVRLIDEMRAKKPAEPQLIAVIETAILNEAVQPWMYEALALALHNSGAPAKRVERAVLSAAEFCEQPLDLMNVAFIMRTMGMKQKAFPLYKQALEALAIPKQEFYSATLRLANELFNEFGDEESLRWICLAVLSLEWDGDAGRRLSTKALDSIRVIETRMKRSGRSEEADRLAQEIKEARLRDCVVTIEWTGSAGLDLMVREPTDAFCWFNNPMTLSGGMVKLTPITDNGTAVTGTLNEQSGTKRISYVCPKGFNGTYTVVVVRDWGEPTNNMVKIAVDTNIMAGDKPREGAAFTLPPEGAIVRFTLDNGRRTEPLDEARLEVASTQMDVARQLLVRNNALKRLSDDGVLGQIVGGSGQTGKNVGGGGYTGAPYASPYYYGRSAIGYRPVLTWLDDGINMQSNAVVSADRRYVRMSPYFPVEEIRTFYSYNMSGGLDDIEDEADSGGSSGGGGGGSSSSRGGSSGGSSRSGSSSRNR